MWGRAPRERARSVVALDCVAELVYASGVTNTLELIERIRADARVCGVVAYARGGGDDFVFLKREPDKNAFARAASSLRRAASCAVLVAPPRATAEALADMRRRNTRDASDDDVSFLEEADALHAFASTLEGASEDDAAGVARLSAFLSRPTGRSRVERRDVDVRFRFPVIDDGASRSDVESETRALRPPSWRFPSRRRNEGKRRKKKRLFSQKKMLKKSKQRRRRRSGGRAWSARRRSSSASPRRSPSRGRESCCRSSTKAGTRAARPRRFTSRLRRDVRPRRLFAVPTPRRRRGERRGGRRPRRGAREEKRRRRRHRVRERLGGRRVGVETGLGRGAGRGRGLLTRSSCVFRAKKGARVFTKVIRYVFNLKTKTSLIIHTSTRLATWKVCAVCERDERRAFAARRPVASDFKKKECAKRGARFTRRRRRA